MLNPDLFKMLKELLENELINQDTFSRLWEATLGSSRLHDDLNHVFVLESVEEKIPAIKVLREFFKYNLKEAHEIVCNLPHQFHVTAREAEKLSVEMSQVDCRFRITNA